ncbi:MAG: galactokinase family protein [Candidatus Hydrogenedentota bacterium]
MSRPNVYTHDSSEKYLHKNRCGKDEGRCFVPSEGQRGRFASIVLCAGKGRRMQSPKTPKVCFPVAGKPAICHLMESLETLGSGPNILVVGYLAGTVVNEVGPKFPQALFAYQEQLLGTGHATRQGANVLTEFGYQGPVLVVAGDKLIEPRTLEKLLTAFERDKPDMALVVAPKERWPNAGRIVTDTKGRLLKIIEKADLEKAQQNGATFHVEGESRTAEDIENSVKWVNQAVYLFQAPLLYEALANLRRNNVQQEEYLTDTIDYLVSKSKHVTPVPVDAPEDVLGFNNPSELLEIEEHFRAKLGLDVAEKVVLDPEIFKPPETWRRILANPDGAVTRMLKAIYGDNQALCEEKRSRLLRAVEFFIERYGKDGKVMVVRAPGRVNLMGRHVDHRGGCVNLTAIDREHILVARARNDTRVRAHNLDTDTFEDLEFSVDDLLRQVRLDQWRDFVDSEAVIRMVRDLQGNWGNYLKAPMLRLQEKFKDRRIHGVDCVVSGDIPMAAGLSSSSALVVAMGEALVSTNGLDVTPNDLVYLCGEGEWFVGTRGGSADHAAVKLSQSGQIVTVGFFPFSIRSYVPFPEEYSLIIANSRIQARKAAGGRDAFNERVASYELAVHWVRKLFPNYAPLIHHLRDISPEGLGVRAADIYRILLDVPETVSADTLKQTIGSDTFERITTMHTARRHYPLRARLLFGISECERSKMLHRLLLDNDMERVGWLMNISHDGDRVVSKDGSPFAPPLHDDYLNARISDLQSEDPDRVLAGQLYAQPGAYACSIPQIDRMADIATGIPGVLGAQLCGAGLGGCMMVLAKAGVAEEVTEQLNRLYYTPNGLELGARAFVPIAGCSSLRIQA